MPELTPGQELLRNRYAQQLRDFIHREQNGQPPACPWPALPPHRKERWKRIADRALELAATYPWAAFDARPTVTRPGSGI